MPKTDVTHIQLLLELWQLQQPREVVALLRGIGRGRVSPAAQEELLACIRHHVTEKYLQRQYLSQLLRKVILAAEADGQETPDDLADLHATLLLQPSAEAACWRQKVFCYAPATLQHRSLLQALPANEEELSPDQLGLISLHVSQNLIEGGTGCHEWEAGFVLARFVLGNASLFKGRRCVELGAGAGLVGICLHRVGAGFVLLTDRDAQALCNCRRNLEENGVALGEGSQALDWAEHRCLEADLILGADLLYDPGAHRDLLLTLRASLHGASDRPVTAAPVAYLATTVRDAVNQAAFDDMLEPLQLRATTVQWDGCSTPFRHLIALRHGPPIIWQTITAA